MSRLAFLSGGRGTGKTTILLSLAHELREARGNITPVRDRSGSGTSDSGSEPTELVKELARRIVWLEHLDIEATPDDANLLVGILARVESALRDSSSATQNFQSRNTGIFDPSPEHHNSLLQLQQLQADVALSWQGNLVARGANLDPDVYALEAMRAEQARLRLNPRLARVLDDLARQSFYGHEVRDPIFLLPIDDFDINPAICLPLLRLVRMLSVPRLFVLLLGDIEIAKVVLNLNVSGQLAAMTGQGSRDEKLLAVPMSDIGTAAGEIAFNALRKLVPPSQRVTLGPLRPAEALSFCPLNRQEDQPFHRLLADVPIDISYLPKVEGGRQIVGRKISNLRDFLLIQSFSLQNDDDFSLEHEQLNSSERPKVEEILERTWEKHAYQALDFLNAPVRRLTDLWFDLDEVVGDQKNTEAEEDLPNLLQYQKQGLFESESDFQLDHQQLLSPEVISFFARVAQSALEEDRATDRLSRNELPGALGTVGVGTPDLSLLDITPYSIRHAEKQVTALLETVEPERDDARPIEVSAFLKVAGHKMWQLSVGDISDEDRKNRRRYRLSSQAASSLIFFHDLVVLGTDYPSIGRRSVTPFDGNVDDDQQPWAVIEWRQGSLRRFDDIRWPIPSWQSYWEFDLFLHAWSKEVEEFAPVTIRGPEKNIVVWLAFAWISCCLAVLSGNKPMTVRRSAGWRQSGPSNDDWKELLNRLDRLAAENSRTTLRGRRLRDWLVRLALMTLPESGLPQDAREKLSASDKMKNLWRVEATRISDLHRSQLDRYSGSAAIRDLLQKTELYPAWYVHATNGH
ncbi:MAG: hypothetical protein AAFY56_13580 [Pseudomonadota bacterium]